MKKVILIGCFGMEASSVLGSLQELQRQNIEVLIANDKKQVQEIRNKAFEQEPIRFHNHRQLDNPIFYEPEPSKFIGKPKRNFKK